MKWFSTYPLSGFAFALLLASPGWAAEPFTLFGLSHRPLGGAETTSSSGNLVVTPGGGGGGPGAFGVSIDLGEADSGVFVYLDTYNSFQNEGDSTRGEVYGQLNGVPDQFICSLRANTVDWNGTYEIQSDFSALGSSTVTYQVYSGGMLVGMVTGATAPVLLSTTSEYAPRGNPFWRLPDGSVAAVIQLSSSRGIQLPGQAGEWISGDRIVIRPENIVGLVDFASRLEVWAGGGEDLIVVTQERLGVFGHSHKALGTSKMDALAGQLTLRDLGLESGNGEMGVSIELDEARHFGVKLQAQELTTNAALVASAVGGSDQAAGEYLGNLGMRNREGTLQIFGDFSFFGEGLHVSVYRDGGLVGTVGVPTSQATIDLTGSPRVIGFEAMGETGPTHSGLAILLDQVTTFSLPGGSLMAGDQLGFHMADSTALDRLLAFSLTCSNLSAFTITGESGPQTLSLVDYFPEVSAAAFLKKFAGADQEETQILRSSTHSNVDGRTLVVIRDQAGEAEPVSVAYSFQEDGLYYHGGTTPQGTLFGVSGLRVLSKEFAVGQTFFSQSRFSWRGAGSEEDVWVEVSSVAKVAAYEVVEGRAGTFPAVRLETVMTLIAPGIAELPVTWGSTNWLGEGIGVVRFVERQVFESGTERQRWGELRAYVLQRSLPRSHTVNVGANIILTAEFAYLPTVAFRWLKDGERLPVEESGPPSRLRLLHLDDTSAGLYSVEVVLRDEQGDVGMMMTEVGRVQIIPFADTAPFWAATFGGHWYLNVAAVAVDGAGNVYAAGTFNSQLFFGTNTMVSRGQEDAFLAKFSATGEILWLKRAGSTGSDYARSVALDGSGNVYLTGKVSGTADFGSLSCGGPAMFVARIDSEGVFQRVTRLASSGDAHPAGLAVDLAGNQYLLGAFYGTLALGDLTLVNPGWSSDMFLARLNPDGECVWANQVDGHEGYMSPSSLVLDPAAGLYVVGAFQQTAYFPSGPLSSGARYQAGFVAKTDLDGNYLWAKTVGSEARSVTLDLAGHLYLTGYFEGVASFDNILLSSADNSGGYSAFVAKMTPGGTYVWARVSAANGSYSGAPLVADSVGNLYIAGSIWSEGTRGGTIFAQPEGNSTILTKLDANGRSLWHKQVTGVGQNWPATLAKDNAGNVYLAGEFREGVGFGDVAFPSVGSENAFIVQITGAVAPVISEQPQSQSVEVDSPATFTVSATGTEPWFYQWRQDGMNIEGATGRSYTIDRTRWADRGTYSVVVRNAGGVATSANATLQVNAPEAGTLSFEAAAYTVAESNTTVLVTVLRSGNTSVVATASVRTSGGTAAPGVDYWITDVSLCFAPGETVKTVVVPIADDLESEPAETVKVHLYRPGVGVNVGEPGTATITITDTDVPGAPAIRVQPYNRSVSQGSDVTFAVVARGAAPLSFQWWKNGVSIPGATNPAYRLENVQFSDEGAYRVLVSNLIGELWSAEATLRVLPAPVILVQPQSQTVPYAERVTLSVTATSSLPVVTQTVALASVNGGGEWYNMPAGGNGMLYVAYDFGNDPDRIDVYVSRNGWEPWVIASLTTNGTGVFEIEFGYPPVDQLSIAVTPEVEGNNDGWSCRADRTISPLNYRWLKNGSPTYGGFGPNYYIDYVTFNDAGNYTVIVSDALGSIVSDVAVLTVTGPLLQIAPVNCENGEPGCVQVFWRAGDFHLEMLEDPERDEWVDVLNAYSGIILPAPESQTFFRLRRNDRPD